MSIDFHDQKLRELYIHLQDVLGDLQAYIVDGKLDDAWFAGADEALDEAASELETERCYGKAVGWRSQSARYILTRAIITSCRRLLDGIKYAVAAMGNPETFPAALSSEEFLQFIATMSERPKG